MRIFISTGEPSGDLHAANLVEALRDRLPAGTEFVGFGGPHLARTGARILYPLTELAVMWFGRVLINFHRFLALASVADRAFAHERPDAVVLIDYPGFHWWVARRAKARGIPVVYYVPPQIWAWAGWRVKKMRRYVDHVLCSLPFEPAWYHARGVPGAAFVGHPYFDELAERRLDDGFLAAERAKSAGRPVVALLPGSRSQELSRNFPMMLRAAAAVHRDRPDARFVVACLRDHQAARARELVRAGGFEGLPLEVFAGRTPELIRLADAAWAVSGSVGLELMVEALPTVVVYRTGPLDMWIARWFIKSKYISLVNLLADAEVMPEHLGPADVSGPMAEQMLTWLNKLAERDRAAARLADLRDRAAATGASARAADRIAAIVGARGVGASYQGPHRRIPARREAR